VNALRKAASILFIICVPVLLVTTNVRLAANQQRLYEYGFDKFDVGAEVGLTDAELRDFAGQLIRYFNSDEEFLDTTLFNQREISHLKDVKGLIQLDYTLQIASLSFMALFVAANFALRRRAFGRMLAKRLFWASGLTIGLLAIFGFWASTDFNSLFLLFHLIGFRNDLWQLNPGDNMILMFPPEFFDNAALFAAGATIVEAAIIGGASWAALRVTRRPPGERPPELPETGDGPRVEV
jgi:integral membrane protein (TIGR01906 family)